MKFSSALLAALACSGLAHADRNTTLYASARANGASEDSACRYAQNDAFLDLGNQCRNARGTLGSVDYGQCRTYEVYPNQVEATVNATALCRVP